MTRLLAQLRDQHRGVALIEFALMAPIFITMILGGSELANYITVRMRISQIALQIADNAARMGNGSKLSAKKITDADINDLFQGAQMESGGDKGLDLKKNGRVILSDVEPVANTATNSTYKIGWQRCFGNQTSHASAFGRSGDTNLAGVGPSTALATGYTQTIALQDGATMFVEVFYKYQPLIAGKWIAERDITEVASMSVRDRRDLTSDFSAGAAATHPDGVYKVAGVTPATCS